MFAWYGTISINLKLKPQCCVKARFCLLLNLLGTYKLLTNQSASFDLLTNQVSRTDPLASLGQSLKLFTAESWDGTNVTLECPEMTKVRLISLSCDLSQPIGGKNFVSVDDDDWR